VRRRRAGTRRAALGLGRRPAVRCWSSHTVIPGTMPVMSAFCSLPIGKCIFALRILTCAPADPPKNPDTLPINPPAAPPPYCAFAPP
jgi:hypothetical protein